MVITNLSDLKAEALLRIDEVFPEMNWERKGNKWQSGYYPNGENGERDDRCVIKDGAEAMLVHGYGRLSVVDAVIIYKLNGNAEDSNSEVARRNFNEATKYIAEKLGVEYKPETKEEQFQDVERSKFEKKVWAMQNQLLTHPDMDCAMDYLKGRGFTIDQIKSVGFGVDSNNNHLRIMVPMKVNGKVVGIIERWFLPNDVAEIEKVKKEGGKGIFLYNYKDKETGQQKEKWSKSKYEYAGGSKSGEYLYNAPRRAERIVIVEGIMDALKAEAFGIPGVVALGRNTITEDQIEHLREIGCKQVYILLDENDEGGAKGRLQVIERLKKESLLSVFIPSLRGYSTKEEKVDLADWLNEGTAKQFNGVLVRSKLWFEYKADLLAESYLKNRNSITWDNLYRGVYDLATQLQPYEREKLFVEVSNKVEWQFSKEGMEQYVREVEKAQREYSLKAKIVAGVNNLKAYLDRGDFEGYKLALGTLKELEFEEKEGNVKDILRPYSINDFRDDQINIPASIELSEYIFHPLGKSKIDIPLRLPSAGITLICGAPSNGKSTLLRNIALKLAEMEYQERKEEKHIPEIILYYTYEESKVQIITELLNANYNDDLNKSKYSNSNLDNIRGWFRGEGNYIAANKKEDFDLKCMEFFSNYTANNILNIIDTDNDIEKVSEDIRAISKRYKIKAVFFDYFQLIHSRKAGSKEQRIELKQVGLELNNLAKDLNIPIILAAQLKREAYYSPFNFNLGQIADAADIERIASLVIMLWKTNVGGVVADENDKAKRDKIGTTLQGNFSFNKSGFLYAAIKKNRLGENDLVGGFWWRLNTGWIGSADNYQEED